MKADLLLLHDKSDKAEADSLLAELEMLGIDAQAQQLGDATKVVAELATTKADYAVALFLLSEQMAKVIQAKSIDLSKAPKEAIVVGYQVSQTTQTTVSALTKGVIFSARKSHKALAEDVLEEIRTRKLDSRLTAPKGIDNLWRTPLYIFKKPDGLKDEKEILIDVTWSAKPTRPEMAPSLQEMLRETLEHLKKKELKILDFGAGKLRHTVPLLELGHSVDAVEYRELFHDPSNQVKSNLTKARSYGKKFTSVVYPSQFIKLKRSYDLVMLINVLNVMPEPLERLFVLARCNRALPKGGHLLWFCQHGDATQLKATAEKLTDGGCTSGPGRKTFYKDYRTQDEVIRLLRLMGFSHVDTVKVEAGKNHALLFKKQGNPAMDIDQVVLAKRIVAERKVFKGSTPSELAIGDVLNGKKYTGYGGAMAAGLEMIDPGKAGAYNYEDLVVPILEYIFDRDFKGTEIDKQYEINNGKQRIDIKTDWRDSSSLRTKLKDMGLNCSMVPIECKNYNKPLANPEYGQIVLRCHKKHRHFGMVLCRDVQDRKKVNEVCHDLWNTHEYLIIVLDDADLKKMLEKADIDDYDGVLKVLVERIEEVRDQR
jgi:hypothetical protein